MSRTLWVLAAVLTVAAPAQQETAASIVAAVDSEASAAQAFFEKLVNQNSGTFHSAGVRAVGEMMDAELRALGFETRFIPMDSIGRAPHLIATRPGKGANGAGRPILLIGHMDTVFEPSSPFQKFERKPGGRTASGPGVSDMKGGLTVLLTALKALQKTGKLDGLPITVFLTADEEAPGDLTVTRRDLIAAGKAARAALCFETGIRGVTQDMASTARRGFTGWTVRSTGKAGHSGGIFSENAGYGAVFEMSRVLNEFQQTLREPNMTFNVGLLVGGADAKVDRAGEASVKGKDNIIPAEAVARGEVRALSPEQVARIKDRMYAIAAKSLPGTKTEIKFEEGYPPMAPTAGNKRLLKLLNEASTSAGLGELGELDPMQRGAGDISFIAPYVDSLSGLGAIGQGAHAAGEQVDLESIPRQAKRAALLILRVAAAVR
jgi:glutamate carboxypeptidase